MKKVLTFNKNVFLDNSKELLLKIDYTPDIIVGVLNGGGHVLEVFKQLGEFKDVKFCLAKFQRDDTIKNNVVARFLLKKLPYNLLNYIRVVESKKAKNTIRTFNMDEISKIKLEFDVIPEKLGVKRILIVDDALDTGKTMYVFKNNLQNMFPNAEIKTAVIAWTIDSSIVKPNYYLYKNVLIRYPWAKDYKGKDFEK